ncbi:MAG TPA: transcriptional regulator [Clostridiales bacterium]|nr:transcriptional regulator [Clostridiales bacterium]
MNEKVKDIAARIKGLRLIEGLSSEDVAKSIGLDVQEYMKYENGEDDMPISMLYAVSDFYHVDLTEILTGVSPKLRDVCYVKKGEGLKVERYDQYDFQSLAYKYANRKIEPLLVTLNPDNQPELVTHKGQEFNYCLEGLVKVVVGDSAYVLSPGDSLYFNPMIPHKMVTIDDKPAKYITVILL